MSLMPQFFGLDIGSHTLKAVELEVAEQPLPQGSRRAGNAVVLERDERGRAVLRGQFQVLLAQVALVRADVFHVEPIGDGLLK